MSILDMTLADVAGRVHTLDLTGVLERERPDLATQLRVAWLSATLRTMSTTPTPTPAQTEAQAILQDILIGLQIALNALPVISAYKNLFGAHPAAQIQAGLTAAGVSQNAQTVAMHIINGAGLPAAA